MIRRCKSAATRKELWTLLLLAGWMHMAKKKGHGGPHGPPLPPPDNPPPPNEPPPGGGGPPPGGSSDLNFGSIGKYNPIGHPYTDRVPAAQFPAEYIHTEYGFDTFGNAIGAFVDVNFIDSGNRATNTALLQAQIDAARVLNQNTRMLLPSTFPMYAPDMKEITNAGKWIYIQRSVAPAATGLRANPINMATAPECMVPAPEEPCIYFNRKASRYWIEGIRFVMNPLINHTYFLIPIYPRESSVEYDTDIVNINNEIILNQCLVQGDDTGTGTFSGKTRHGVYLNGKRSALINSYIHQITEIGGEAHGILISNTPGLLKVVNNFVECACIGTLIGGELPHLGAVLGRPNDIEYRRNYHTKRLSWCQTGPTWDGLTGRNGKGLFETKNVNRILIEGNVFDGCWADGQAGMIFVIKSGIGSGEPAAGVGSTNLVIRYNLFNNSPRGINFAALSDETDAIPASKAAFYDNLITNIGSFQNQVSGWAWILHEGFNDLYIRHNTQLNNVLEGIFNVDYPSSPRAQNFTHSDNIFMTAFPGNGVFMSGGLVGSAAINAWAENPYWERNIMVGPHDDFIISLHPQGTNLYPADQAAMNFGVNYRLTAASPGWQAGVNGKNLGADIDKVELATSGVVS